MIREPLSLGVSKFFDKGETNESSDFVPAAKLARREGIDFILDPMNANIKDDLFEHIDGLRSQWNKKKDSR